MPAGRRAMKITAIESLQWPDHPRLLFVRVHTDAGVVGIGETVEKVAGTRGALHGIIAPLVLGQDPRDIEGLWRFVLDNLMYHGYSGAELRALSAVEIALWDIVGRFYQVPLYQLLGGKTREQIPTYNTCISFGSVRDYEMWRHGEAAALARSLLQDGIRAMKIWPFDTYSERSRGQYISPSEIEQALIPIRQIRDAVGSDMEIGIECHFRWNRAMAERIIRTLEPYDILFVEDPMPAVHLEEIRLLSQRSSIPIVGSETLMTRWQVREWLEKHVTPILMTDPLWSGGLAETRRMAALADTYGVPLVLHNLAGPVAHAVAMHLGAHIHNLFFVESSRALYRTTYDVLTDYAPRPEDGFFVPPEGPGLGLDFRPEALADPHLRRQVSEGEGKAVGRRAMGDHWEREDIR
ncbi:MAG: mandelate racemase/muconate lactonizing enzyme family protein [Caldilineae bacterium]|nr:MAG: mandelate racemase/muconate lactonizing enzyme family protein [Caldilineae bacterium]